MSEAASQKSDGVLSLTQKRILLVKDNTPSFID